MNKDVQGRIRTGKEGQGRIMRDKDGQGRIMTDKDLQGRIRQIRMGKDEDGPGIWECSASPKPPKNKPKLLLVIV